MTQEIFDEIGTLVSAPTTTFRNVQGEPKAYTNVVFAPINASGKAYTGEGLKRGGFQEGLIASGSQDVLTSIPVGGAITLKVTLNESGGRTYKNISSIINGHVENPNRIPFESKSSNSSGDGVRSSSGGDYNNRAAIGQALNLAMNEARAVGMSGDDSYILGLLPRFLSLGTQAQTLGATILAAASAPAVQQAVAIPNVGVPIAAPVVAPVMQQAAPVIQQPIAPVDQAVVLSSGDVNQLF